MKKIDFASAVIAASMAVMSGVLFMGVSSVMAAIPDHAAPGPNVGPTFSEVTVEGDIDAKANLYTRGSLSVEESIKNVAVDEDGNFMPVQIDDNLDVLGSIENSSVGPFGERALQFNDDYDFYIGSDVSKDSKNGARFIWEDESGDNWLSLDNNEIQSNKHPLDLNRDSGNDVRVGYNEGSDFFVNGDLSLGSEWYLGEPGYNKSIVNEMNVFGLLKVNRKKVCGSKQELSGKSDSQSVDEYCEAQGDNSTMGPGSIYADGIITSGQLLRSEGGADVQGPLWNGDSSYNGGRVLVDDGMHVDGYTTVDSFGKTYNRYSDLVSLTPGYSLSSKVTCDEGDIILSCGAESYKNDGTSWSSDIRFYRTRADVTDQSCNVGGFNTSSTENRKYKTTAVCLDPQGDYVDTFAWGGFTPVTYTPPTSGGDSTANGPADLDVTVEYTLEDGTASAFPWFSGQPHYSTLHEIDLKIAWNTPVSAQDSDISHYSIEFNDGTLTLNEDGGDFRPYSVLCEEASADPSEYDGSIQSPCYFVGNSDGSSKFIAQYSSKLAIVGEDQWIMVKAHYTDGSVGQTDYKFMPFRANNMNVPFVHRDFEVDGLQYFYHSPSEHLLYAPSAGQGEYRYLFDGETKELESIDAGVPGLFSLNFSDGTSMDYYDTSQTAGTRLFMVGSYSSSGEALLSSNPVLMNKEINTIDDIKLLMGWDYHGLSYGQYDSVNYTKDAQFVLYDSEKYVAEDFGPIDYSEYYHTGTDVGIIPANEITTSYPLDLGESSYYINFADKYNMVRNISLDLNEMAGKIPEAMAMRLYYYDNSTNGYTSISPWSDLHIFSSEISNGSLATDQSTEVNSGASTDSAWNSWF